MKNTDVGIAFSQLGISNFGLRREGVKLPFESDNLKNLSGETNITKTKRDVVALFDINPFLVH